MGIIEANSYFKKGQIDNALIEINDIDPLNSEAKVMKSLLLIYKSQIKDALKITDEVLNESINTQNLNDEFRARFGKGLALLRISDFSNAFDELNKAEKLYEKLKKPIKEIEKIFFAELIVEKAITFWILFGDLSTALKQMQQAGDIFSEEKDYRGSAKVLNLMSEAYFQAGELDKSKELAEKSLIISRKWYIGNEETHSLRRIGEYYFSIGELDLALDFLKQGIKIIEKLESPWYESYLRLSLGIAYLRQGNFQSSQNELDKSVKLAQEVGDGHLVARGVLHIGDIHLKKGDIKKTIDKFQEAFRIFRQKKDPNCSIDTNLRLGKAYVYLGELDLALGEFQNSFLHRRWNWTDNQPSDDVPINAYAYPETVYQLILVTLEFDFLELALEYFEKLKDFNDKKPNDLVKYRLELAEALILKRDKRIKQKIKAQDMLESLISRKVVDQELTITAILNYCDMLISELKISGEKEVLKEIQELIIQLLTISKKQGSVPLQIETLCLQANVALISSEAKEAKQILDQAKNFAKEANLPIYLEKVQIQQSKLILEMDKWKSLISRNASIQELLETTDLKNFITSALKTALTQGIGPQILSIADIKSYKKYELIYKDVLKDLSQISKNTCRIGVSQIGLSIDNDLISDFYEETQVGLFGLKNEKLDLIRNKVKQMVEKANSENVNILLFPELTIDLNYPELKDDIIRYSKKYGMYIIPGSYHSNESRRNVSVVFSPEGILWEQEKYIPATISYEGRYITEGIDVEQSSRKIIVCETEYGRIVVVICRDFLDMDLRVELKNFDPPIDLVFNLAFTPVTADFRAAHFDARRSIYAYCFFANVAEYGDSLIYTPEKERIERTIPSGEEGLIYKDVNIFNLRSERKKWELSKNKEKSFIQSTK
jgi:tetratricopeptide (TPR) repeat protein